MPHLTPSDIRSVAFRKPAFGRRGYDEQDVDEFLDQVESTISALTEELTALRGQSTSAVAPAAAPAGVGVEPQVAILAQLEEIRARLTRIEAAVAGGGPRSPFGDPMFRS
ncbi:DivIVA domain-containing protein [Plantactinospora sp. ZYX-F-223]|uniref:DivIVA domain-containing protein n=1 Tax=Plantactinospora sp. ZYX-F-223 TaxID=3144103 RepID=UPI0031FD3E7A